MLEACFKLITKAKNSININEPEGDSLSLEIIVWERKLIYITIKDIDKKGRQIILTQILRESVWDKIIYKDARFVRFPNAGTKVPRRFAFADITLHMMKHTMISIVYDLTYLLENHSPSVRIIANVFKQ